MREKANIGGKMAQLYRVEHQQKFKHREQAIKEANTITKFVWRLAQKEKRNCKVLVCISEHSIKDAEPYFCNQNTRGRPKRKFRDKFDTNLEAPKVKPHLHILIMSDKANDLAYRVVSNINKRYRRRNPSTPKAVISRRYRVENPDKYIGYVMHQGTAKRFVECDYGNILNDFDYEQIYESYKPNLF